VSLDCLTLAGRASTALQHRALSAAQRHFKVDVAPTDDLSSAAVDAVLMKDGVIAGIVEVKSRRLTVEGLQAMGSLLISENKLEALRKLAPMLSAEGFVFAYLTLAQVVAWWRVCDEHGHPYFLYQTAVTRTQATVNGGVADRLNAFLPVEHAGYFRVDT
jgi:hypothetical protein